MKKKLGKVKFMSRFAYVPYLEEMRLRHHDGSPESTRRDVEHSGGLLMVLRVEALIIRVFHRIGKETPVYFVTGNR